MDTNFINLLWLSGLFLLLFISAECLYHFAKVQVEYTRKLVHIGTGLLTMLFPLFFSHYAWVIGICMAFFVILCLSLKYGFLPSINAIERKSFGSLVYPLVVAVTFVFYQLKSDAIPAKYYYFYLPILVMALADPLAALLGKKIPLGPYKIGQEHKTLLGSFVFFIVAFALTFYLLPSSNLFVLLMIPLAATLAEAFSPKGLDNLSVPVIIMLILSCL